MFLAELETGMRKLLMIIAATGLLTLAAGMAQADERFVPKGFLYTPENTQPPPIGSPAYRIITEADRRESEIYVSKKLRADFEDFMVHNLEKKADPMRNGWRRY